MAEHLFIVTYDIRDASRWRQVFRIMKGYGAWLQLSVFQCRMSRSRQLRLKTALASVLGGGDHVLIMDLGPADQVQPKVESLGPSFTAIARESTIF